MNDADRFTDDGPDKFLLVCDECGRHVAVAGHADDCPNQEDEPGSGGDE